VVYSKFEKERRAIPMPSAFDRAIKQAEEEAAAERKSQEPQHAGSMPFNTPIFIERAE